MTPPITTERLEDDLAEALWALLVRLPGTRTTDGTLLPSWVILRASEAYQRWSTTRSKGRPDQVGPDAGEDPDPEGRFRW